MTAEPNIKINLDNVEKGLNLWIDARRDGTLFDAESSAEKNNEARFQLAEGCFYDYKLSDEKFFLGDIGENIVQQHRRVQNIGTLAPNICVGTLEIPLFRIGQEEPCYTIKLEVQSVKSNYREDYRDMLELITEKCTDLLLQANSPISQKFDIDFEKDSQSLYQKFAFIKSVISSDEFHDAINRIITAPVTVWSESSELKDIRSVRKFTSSSLKELVKGSNRTQLPPKHYLKKYGLKTIPERITSSRKIDSVDTPENRFIKHALETFLKFCNDINKASKKDSKLDNESNILSRELESHLHHTIFQEISRPTTLKLNSPVLQRKEGYREVLRVWLMFELAAKLIWKGGEDVYGAGKKDVANLYEYWLFFKLLDLFQSIFDIDPKHISELIETSNNELNVRIKQGKFTALDGVYDSGNRKLNVRFNYNRSFSGKNNYPSAGSWTTTLRPDYTLSFWPFDISETEAENQELIVHIHFDAKYKIANFTHLIGKKSETELDDEKVENLKGVYKNADLMKMHAYKDAIRRTGGAYVLYPGDKSIKRKGFHEVIPGLGAFPVRPSKTDDGIADLKGFILEIIEHFLNRASQREKIAYRTYDIFKSKPNEEDNVNEVLPETYGENRGLLPDETFVLIGFYNSTEQYDWIKKNKLYNFRMGTRMGSLLFDNETVNSKYLLLHTKNDKSSGDLWRITSKGPKVLSKNDMVGKGYASPSQDYYLVIELEPINDPEFKDVNWEFKKLSNYSSGRASAVPFTASVSELMKVKM